MFEVEMQHQHTRGRPESPRILRARMVLGAGILRTRLFREWSQQALEERSGLDQTVISRLECGAFVNVRLTRMLSLIAALGVDDVVLVPAELRRETSSVDELLNHGIWAAADARVRDAHATRAARAPRASTISLRRSA